VGTDKRPAVTWPVGIDQAGKSIPFTLHQERTRLRVPELKVPIKHPGTILTGNPGLEFFFGKSTFTGKSTVRRLVPDMDVLPHIHTAFSTTGAWNGHNLAL
jgi:hypothetical protein